MGTLVLKLHANGFLQVFVDASSHAEQRRLAVARNLLLGDIDRFHKQAQWVMALCAAAETADREVGDA
jgi:hypothetical protein